LTKHVGFVGAYVKKAKNRKINDEKGGDKQNTARLISTMKNKTHFSLWVLVVIFKMLYYSLYL